MQVIWEEFLKIIKEEAGTSVVETWFKAVTLERWSPEINTVFLHMPNSFVSNWIQEHYNELIKTHLSRLLHAANIKIFFLLGSYDQQIPQTIIPATSLQKHAPLDMQNAILKEIENFKELRNNKNYGEAQIYPAQKNALALRNFKKSKYINGSLNDQFTFDSFVVGPNNSLAHAAAYAVSQNLGKVYNPLFIYGGTGLGKTHLLHAIGNSIKKSSPDIKICYERADQFMNEFINAIRLDKIISFREKYQKVDLLLLDDIQFFSSKEQTQEIFFHIFNSLNEQGKQIVFSSDMLPKDIAGLQSRLKSRLQSGLTADIQMPTLETKIAILKTKAYIQKIDLCDEVASFIASLQASSIRELEGYLIRVSAFALLMKEEISLHIAKKALSDYHTSSIQNEKIPFDVIVKTTSKYFNISLSDLKSGKRNKTIAFARQISFYLMKKLTSESLQNIGAYFGGRDHSTVLHATKKIESLIEQNLEMAQKISNLEKTLLQIK